MSRVPITSVRLTDDDLARVAALREWYGLPSLTAALRYAVGIAYRGGAPTAAPAPRKISRKSPATP